MAQYTHVDGELEKTMIFGPDFALKLIAAALVIGIAIPLDAAELNPAAVAVKIPDQLKWRDPTDKADVNQAVVFGDPTKPGFYVVMNRYKAGAFSRPHFHPNDGFVTVLKGTLWVGTGAKFDISNTVAMPAGTVMQHAGKQIHFQGAKGEEALILVTGEGPATATPAEEK
jgi:quercetin dioxygenase-like cupin family protein